MKLRKRSMGGGSFWQSQRRVKARNGNGHTATAFNPVEHATKGQRCPLRLYKRCLKRRLEPTEDHEAT